jgi:hypothetical protein
VDRRLSGAETLANGGIRRVSRPSLGRTLFNFQFLAACRLQTGSIMRETGSSFLSQGIQKPSVGLSFWLDKKAGRKRLAKVGALR